MRHFLVTSFALAAVAAASPILAQTRGSGVDLPVALQRVALEAVNRDAGVTPVWVEQRVNASDGSGGDQFGWSVAIEGNTALVGASIADVGPNVNQGAVYVFTETDGVWSETQKLTAPDGASDDFFGFSVALEGNTAIVGSLYTGGNAGGAYVFTRSGGTWTMQQKLVAAGTIGADFGSSVALEGDVALVGAPYASSSEGAAFVFTRAGTVWTHQSTLLAPDGAEMDEFGSTVAMSGNTALVGAESAAVGDSTDQGAAYVFTGSGPTWTFQQKLTASDGTAGDGFGNSVSLVGSTALVGAYFATVNGQDFRGAAYVFTESGGSWSQAQRLIAPDGQNNDYFGVSVSLADSTALVGALYATENQGGAGYIFYRVGAAWEFATRVTPADGRQDDAFGNVVAVQDDRALVGAYPGQGKAYFFMALDPPVASVSTTNLEVTVASGATTTAAFTLANQAAAGSAPLIFDITTGEAPTGVASTRPAPRPVALGVGETGVGASQLGRQDATFVAYSGSPASAWQGEEVLITHSVSQSIVPGAGIACNTKGQGTAENSFWRVFDLVEFDLASISVTSVDVAIEIAEITGSHTSTVRLYRLSGPLRLENLTLVGEASFALAPGSSQIINVPVTGDFDDSAPLVVEWFVPDLRPSTGQLFPGANSEGETAPSYLSSFSCKILQPTALSVIGFPQSHTVMNVRGIGTPALVVAEPRSGSIVPGGAQEVVLTINASATPPGSYAYQALVGTNDPDQPSIVVDIDIDVGPVGTEDDAPLQAFVLDRPTPNPVVDVARIAYTVPTRAAVRLAVYDGLGRHVATLVDAEVPAGRHVLRWDARSLATGSYYFQMETGSFRTAVPVVVAR